MADEKTEQPSGKRLRDAHKKGQVARSRDLSLAMASVVSLVALGQFGERLFLGLAERVKEDLAQVGAMAHRPIAENDLATMAISGGVLVGSLVGPLALMTMAAGVFTHGMQGGWVFTTETLTLNWSRLNPANKLKNLGPSQSGIDVVKTFATVAVISYLSWLTVRAVVEQAVTLAWLTPEAAAATAWNETSTLLWRVSWALGAIALGDYAWQRFRFLRSMRMTKAEVKDEHVMQEGRPEVKRRVRQIQRTMARRRMLNDVKRATVVVTNPTHFAVALEYRRGAMAAPRVLAKGADNLALAIRERARQHGVPIIENKPLARALFDTAEIGQFIPNELFTAVAEVLAQLIRLRLLTV